jgi:hypothetical protein
LIKRKTTISSQIDETIAYLKEIDHQIAKIEDQLKKSIDDNQRFESSRNVLGSFKTETTDILDEADINASVMKELNFPSRREKSLSNAQLAASVSLFRHITALNRKEDKGFDLFDFSKNEQEILNDA